MMGLKNFLSETADFFKNNRAYWIVPALTVLVIFGLLVLYAAFSSIMPFMYTLF